MLMMLGPVAFEVVPLNTHEWSRDTATDYVEKAVVGRRQPLEWVGEGNETMSLSGRVFPEKFGGMSNLSALDQARAAGQPLFLMRGDGRPLGFFVITTFKEKHTHLGAQGVGKLIEFEISIKRSDAPQASGFIGSMLNLMRLF